MSKSPALVFPPSRSLELLICLRLTHPGIIGARQHELIPAPFPTILPSLAHTSSPSPLSHQISDELQNTASVCPLHMLPLILHPGKLQRGLLLPSHGLTNQSFLQSQVSQRPACSSRPWPALQLPPTKMLQSQQEVATEKMASSHITYLLSIKRLGC